MDVSPFVASFLGQSQVIHFLIVEHDGTVRACSPAVAQSLKITEERLLGSCLWDYLTLADADGLKLRVQQNASAFRQPILVNFVDAEQIPYTLRCSLDIQPTHFTVLGEPTSSENQALQEQIRQLTNQLTVLARENARVSKLHATLAAENAAEVIRRQESEERYRIVSELSSDFAFAMTVNADRNLQGAWITGAYARIIGFSQNDVKQRGGFRTLIHPDDLPILAQHRVAILGGQTVEFEVRFITKHGDVRWISLRLIPVQDDAQHRVTRVYGIGRDVTDRKAAADEIQRAHEAEIALRIEQARLEGVRLTAVELSDRINNILAVAIGFLDLVDLRSPLPADASSKIVRARAMINQAAQFISKLHRVVRIETKDTVVGPALDLDRSVSP